MSDGRKPAQRKSIAELEARLAKLEAQLQASPTPCDLLELESSPNFGSRSSSSHNSQDTKQFADRDTFGTPDGSYVSINATQTLHLLDGLPDIAMVNEL